MTLKKTFHLHISGHTFVYDQASAMESLEFLEEMRAESFDPVKWLVRFLLASLVKPPRWKFWTHLTQKEIAKIASNHTTIIDRLMETRYRGSFSHTSEGQTEWTPDMSGYCMVAKEIHTDPLTLLERYTFEQIDEVMQGIIWNMNAQSEEGQKKNEKTRTEHTIGSMSAEEKKIMDDTIKDMMSKDFSPTDYSWSTK